MFRGEVECVVAGGGVGLVGRIAEDVLVAELLVDVGIDFVEGFFLADFEEAGAGGLGDLFENFLAVGALFGAAGITSTVAPGIAAAHAAHVRSAEAAASATVAFLVGEEDAVDEGVGALGGFDGFLEGLLAAVVDPVGEDDQRFAAMLFFHQLIGGEIDGVVEECASATVAGAAVASMATVASSSTSTGGTAATGAGLRELGRVDLVNGRQELLARGGEVLEEFDFAVEVDDEGLVFILAEQVIEEGMAGGDFLAKDAALAEAGVYEQAEGEGKIGFAGEIGDGLGLAVLVELKIVFGEVVDEGAVFIADGGEEIDGADIDGDGSGLLGKSGRQEGEDSQ